MKLRLLSTFAALLSISAVAACATSAKTVVLDPTPGEGTPGDGTTVPTEEESDDPADQPPHSLGTIVLGESHSSGAVGTSTKSTPIVSASFLPDAMLSRACKKKLDESCEIQEAAKCTKVTGSATGCNSNEACVLDSTTCKSVCKAVAVCTKACESDEICKPAAFGSSTTSGTCVKNPTFDAGPLAFSGTTTPITMYPPYEYETTGSGAPFLGGSELRVQASGATEAGFEKFDEKFTATTFLQTTPSLGKISREKIFGTGSIPVAWAPSTDTILVSITGTGGTATCKVKDSLGKFDIPRSVVKAAQGSTTTTGSSSSLSISVARQKKEVKKDKKAKGELAITKVQPDGWLELVTLSAETASFQGCPGSQAMCDEACTDITYDRYNCGECGNTCSSGETCSAGECIASGSSSGSSGGTTTCTTCRSNARAGTCSTYYSQCSSASNDCYYLAACAQSCTTSSCVTSCENQYPSGITAYSQFKSCLTNSCYSSCGF